MSPTTIEPNRNRAKFTNDTRLQSLHLPAPLDITSDDSQVDSDSNDSIADPWDSVHQVYDLSHNIEAMVPSGSILQR